MEILYFDLDFRYAFDCFTCKGVYSIGTYDFASVMHYPFFAFTELYDETRPSMTLKDGSISTIYRAAEYLSDADVYKTKLYYQNCRLINNISISQPADYKELQCPALKQNFTQLS